MALYKITIRLLSPIITPLKGDTIWGHIVWGIANREGEEAVGKFLDSQRQEPEIIVSSAFPSGHLCRPLPPPNPHDEILSVEQYSEIKKEKKRRLVKACNYLNGIDAPKHETETIPFETGTVTRNMIDRETGSVLEGELFSIAQSWPKQSEFDIYAESILSPERIIELFEWAFENGYGADSSTGKGKIEVAAGSLTKVTPKYDTGRYMALGPFVGSPGLKDLHADTFTRTGRLGGWLGECLSPFKKTVVLFDEGAVFYCKEKLSYCGKLLENVHSDPRICQSGFAPVIPIPIPEDEQQ